MTPVDFYTSINKDNLFQIMIYSMFKTELFGKTSCGLRSMKVCIMRISMHKYHLCEGTET